jgi:hypothetical protein
MENSRDDMGLGGQKEEVPQQEIDTSTTNYQVSTRPILDSSILVDTPPTNEKQTEAGPSGHMEEIQEPILE